MESTYQSLNGRDRLPDPKVHFRAYAGLVDIPHMLAVHTACQDVDQVDPYSVAYRVPNFSQEEYAKDVALSLADGSDRNILIAEVAGLVVGHCRLEWWREWDSEQNAERFAYLIRAWAMPDWRKHGIGSHFLAWGEARAKEKNGESPYRGELAANATDGEEDATRLLVNAGYEIRFLSPELAYDDLVNLPSPVTPAGFDIRPVKQEDHVVVARALIESNADASWSAEQLEDWIKAELDYYVDFAAGCDPAISRIGWKDGQVAGLYLCRSKGDVGDVANVAVRREYRLQGLSRSLMFHCLNAMRDGGLNRARVFTGIGADRNAPPEGAYKMYLGFGFRLLTFHNRYRKPLSSA